MSPSAATYTLAAPYSASLARPASAPAPIQTAAGSPNRLASVSSSYVTFLTSPLACSASTRISAMTLSSAQNVALPAQTRRCPAGAAQRRRAAPPRCRFGAQGAAAEPPADEPSSGEPPSDELLCCQEAGGLDATVALVLHDDPCLPWRPLRETCHLGQGCREPHLGRVDLRLGEGEPGHRLRLGGHDALEGGVTRRVDLLDHADDGGQAGFDHVVAIVRLALDPDGSAVDLDLVGQRQLGQREPFREHGAEG